MSTIVFRWNPDTYDNATIGQIIDCAAMTYKVDPDLAKVIAWCQSGFSPTKPGGLFGLPPSLETQNPITNAHTFLPVLVASEAPGLTEGDLAVKACQAAGCTPNLTASIVDDLYTAVSAGDYPPGWVDAINVRTGLTVSYEQENQEPPNEPKSSVPDVATTEPVQTPEPPASDTALEELKDAIANFVVAWQKYGEGLG